MAQSRHISSTTGDYTMLNGAPKGDLTVASELVLALRTRQGSCGADPSFGSRLHTITKLTPTNERRAHVYAREAIRYLIDRGDIRNVAFGVEMDESTFSLCVTISYQDRSGRAQPALPITIPLG